jgi:hypothetical protein
MLGPAPHAFRQDKVVAAFVANGSRDELPPFFRCKLPNRSVLTRIYKSHPRSLSLAPVLELSVFKAWPNSFSVLPISSGDLPCVVAAAISAIHLQDRTKSDLGVEQVSGIDPIIGQPPGLLPESGALLTTFSVISDPGTEEIAWRCSEITYRGGDVAGPSLDLSFSSLLPRSGTSSYGLYREFRRLCRDFHRRAQAHDASV